jgi:hypothetical protein
MADSQVFRERQEDAQYTPNLILNWILEFDAHRSSMEIVTATGVALSCGIYSATPTRMKGQTGNYLDSPSLPAREPRLDYPLLLASTLKLRKARPAASQQLGSPYS